MIPHDGDYDAITTPTILAAFHNYQDTHTLRIGIVGGTADVYSTRDYRLIASVDLTTGRETTIASDTAAGYPFLAEGDAQAVARVRASGNWRDAILLACALDAGIDLALERTLRAEPSATVAEIKGRLREMGCAITEAGQVVRIG